MRVLFALTIIAFFSMVVSPCWAEIPHMVNYQGMLTSDAGTPLDGTYNLSFKIYGSESGNDSLWWEYHSGVTVTDGLFNVILGSTTPIPSSTFDDTMRYFGITVGSDPELSPRIRITSMPYAYRALVADSAAVAGSAAGASGGWVDDGAVVRLENSTDKVGIGTTSPDQKLDVVGNQMRLRASTDPGAKTLLFRTDGTALDLNADNADFYIHSNSGNTVLQGFGGNVGIGTWTPDDDLHVSDHIRVGEDPSYSTVYGELIHDGGGTGFKINAHAGGGGWADMHFQTNKTTKMFIESAGKVGIGTTSPSEKLDVEGNIDVSSNRIKNYFGFPGPDYDSGWLSISQGQTLTLTHSLGGHVDRYFVDLWFYRTTPPMARHNHGYGTKSTGGASWFGLTSEEILVQRHSLDADIDKIRVRIWVYD